jgi:hypothetical protein
MQGRDYPLDREERSVGFPALFGFSVFSELPFRYIELNLTTDHTAIYHPQRWDEGKLALECSSSRRGRKGVSYPSDLDWATTKTLGLRLVRMLGQYQLKGQIELDRANGTSFRLVFASRQREKR